MTERRSASPDLAAASPGVRGPKVPGGGPEAEPPVLRRVVPILRIFDEAKAREFYAGFLGFSWDWEHRFGENFPLYAQVSRSGVALHLSEHHGDGTPGTGLLLYMRGVHALHAELRGKDYRYAKPGIEEAPWGALTVTVTDPFGNRLTFAEPKED
ncbi:glyoxalase superfamily protein [Muricoccus radiodurans]|uniref:glyoxalase superfamily protein n=1 Tax=Muricoccus radiodurans TaxID=2231721 RepID=UPI003CF7B8A4